MKAIKIALLVVGATIGLSSCIVPVPVGGPRYHGGPSYRGGPRYHGGGPRYHRGPGYHHYNNGPRRY